MLAWIWVTHESGFFYFKERVINMKKRTILRFLQRATGIHRVHHIWYSYGYKIPFTNTAYFPSKVFGIRHGFKRLDEDKYHNCTITGVY